MTIARLSAVSFRRRTMRTLLLPALLLFALSAIASTGYAAGSTAGNANVPQLDTGNLVPGIAKQIQKSGEADVLVVLHDSDVRAFAAERRKALGLKYNNAAIIAGRVALLKQKKDTVLSRLSQQNYEVKGSYKHFPVLFLRVNAQALARLQHMSEVKAISENRANRPFTSCTGACTDSQTLIGIPDAWNYLSGQTGAGTAVAVLDTGVNLSSGYFGTCSGGAGSAGCSVVYEQCFATQGLGGTPSCYTDNSHGTNVQGIVLQVAPDTELISLDVFSVDGYAYDSDILAALDWVAANYTTYNIVSTNMSLGSGGYSSPCPDDPLAPTISTLRSDGIASAVAAGNDSFVGLLSSPACAPDAISVGAVYASDYGSLTWCTDSSCIADLCTDTTTAADQVTCFSNSASFLSLLAPGSKITAAGITMSGTSQATPHVAGSIAVLKSQDSGLTVDEEEGRLRGTGVAVTDSKSGITTPRIDLLNAVSVASPILATNPISLDFTTLDTTSQTLKIINAGSGNMNWNISSTVSAGDPQWLVPAPPVSGTVSGLGSVDVSIGINTTGLSAGPHTGQLTVTATDDSGNAVTFSPVTIPVTLNVLDPAYEEDFETGNLTKLPWVSGVVDSNGSAVPGSWSVENTTVYDGTYSAQSPAMSDSESGYLQVTLNVTAPGYVYFWVKTDTQPVFDNLNFYVSGMNEGLWTGWSGGTDWTLVQSQDEIGTGLHTFQWVYSKDSSVSDGADAVWLDDIFFPPFNEVSVSPETSDFGAVPLGQSKGETFTVKNISGANVTIGTPALTGDLTEFSITSGNCSGQSLTAGGTCTVGVTFTPASIATGKSATLSIPVGSTTTTASLSGTGGNMYWLTIDESASNGTGVVADSFSPNVINCGSVCAGQFLQGTSITLSATPDANSYFEGWSDEGCTGTGTCTFTISAKTTVHATFGLTSSGPTAAFSGSPLSGVVPLTVNFTDASTGGPTAWAWDFGDGGEIAGAQPQEINPVYTYNYPGTYTVALTVSNVAGWNTMTKTAYVNVLCPIEIASNTSLDLCPAVSGAATTDGSVQVAFNNAATSGDTVEILNGVVIADNPVLSGGKTLTLRGGYDSTFTTSSGSSTINGSLTVGDGTLTVDSIIIQ